jgi:hypothetical protein
MTQPPVVAGKSLVGPLPLSDEEWREYEWIDELGRVRSYRIAYPKALFYRTGGATHRVVDTSGVTHCIPAPGQLGCVLRWKSQVEVTF